MQWAVVVGIDDDEGNEWRAGRVVRRGRGEAGSAV